MENQLSRPADRYRSSTRLYSQVQLENSIDGNETIEEVRVIVSDTDTMTNIVNAFHDAGIAAFGDYRDDDATNLARDAILDGVEYLVFANQWHLIEVPNFFRKCDDDLLVRIRIRHDEETKTMSIGAAIKMILERRFQRKR